MELLVSSSSEHVKMLSLYRIKKNKTNKENENISLNTWTAQNARYNNINSDCVVV
jgi:hypothetical protein